MLALAQEAYGPATCRYGWIDFRDVDLIGSNPFMAIIGESR